MKLINKPQKGFFEEMDHDEITCELKRWINYLDDTARKYEAKWGIGRLPECVPVDMRQKWEKQREKLQDALLRRDVHMVAELVNGTIRGYAALEQAALAEGKMPVEADFLAVQHEESGQVYHIAKNNENASRAVKSGVIVYTLNEVVNILHSQELINQTKSIFPDAEVTTIEWNGESDEIPF